ncbi:hypothetical protein [Paracoccus caeni]|uniref:hypothetical protein n=1 Tax=Paracoccus caeni TaxID=657651 RepID=UPI001F477480|nr:hypothetical protein [Paracoccus caeni]
MAYIRALALSESVKVDTRRVGDIVRELGETAASNVIGLALEQLASALTETDAAYRENELAAAAVHAERLSRLAWQVGLLSLAGVAMDMGSSAERRDSIAMSAIHARLMRVGNRSLTAIWEKSELR